MKFVGIPVIAVAKSVDDRFAEGFAVDLWNIHSGNRSGFERGFSGGGTEIIAVPEPETYFYAVALLCSIVVQYLRRRAKRKPVEDHLPAFATRAAARQHARLSG